jgi:hypothetical protein
VPATTRSTPRSGLDPRTYWLDKLEMVLRPHGETVGRK